MTFSSFLTESLPRALNKIFGNYSNDSNYINSVVHDMSNIGRVIPSNSALNTQTNVSDFSVSNEEAKKLADSVAYEDHVDHVEKVPYVAPSRSTFSRSTSSSPSLSVKTGSAAAASSPSVSAVNYFDAPLAEQYGMSAETAYQEALSNTAHQREMRDLQRAGLNPVLASHFSGAGVFSPSSMVTAASSGSSGGSGSSAKTSKKTDTVVGDVIGSLVTIITGKSSVGNAVEKIADNLFS